MTYEFQTERLIDASPEDVFDALTDPAHQREWWGAEADIVRATGDAHVGGRARVEWGPDENSLLSSDMVYLEIDRPHRLVYTEVVTEPRHPAYECVLTFTLEAVGGKTRLVLVHTGFPTEEERDVHRRGTEQWFLGRLERYLAGARR